MRTVSCDFKLISLILFGYSLCAGLDYQAGPARL
jgi:hypothetical protein